MCERFIVAAVYRGMIPVPGESERRTGRVNFREAYIAGVVRQFL
jgi:hypothetical protein